MMISWLLGIVLAYFLLLLLVAYRTSRHSNNETFFIGNRSSHWLLVAFGMIGTSLSGVTFISVPGTVGMGSPPNGFAYFQVVIGYWLGYFAIALILLPLYYRLRLTSIYLYLGTRLGDSAHRTGSVFFLLSRTLGATARLYLVINVLQVFLLDALGVPFVVTTVIILLMILLYTVEGGVKTIVWTDTLQTTFMLVGLVVGIFCCLHYLRPSYPHFEDVWSAMRQRGFAKVFTTDLRSPSFFVKQILGGAFITITMTGLDQEMMQKNISVRTLKGSQKNMLIFSLVMALVTGLFLFLGGLLYLIPQLKFIPGGDYLFPTLAMGYFGPAFSILFIIALISALFPSADGAMTALTSSFCIDLLRLQERQDLPEKARKRTRMIVHGSVALVFLACIMAFWWINNKSIIQVILDLATYTYGPLLGLFAFGILTKRNLKFPAGVPWVCVVSPLLCFLLSRFSAVWTSGYKIGFELLVINGLITFLGLFMLSEKKKL